MLLRRLLDTDIYACAINTPAGRHTRRQAECRAVDTLVSEAFGPHAKLSHRSDGAPYIEGDRHNISVSHSHHTAMLAVCATHRIGIDIEEWRQTLRRVAARFLSPDELAQACDDTRLLAAWTVKEAIFKATSHLRLPHSATLADIALPHGWDNDLPKAADGTPPPMATLVRDDGLTVTFAIPDL